MAAAVSKAGNPLSERQVAHLAKLNRLWKTEAHRFRPGGRAWNLKHGGLPRDKYRKPLRPCIDCKTEMVQIYGNASGRCQRCSRKHRSASIGPRIRKSGYRHTSSHRYPEHVQIAERVLGRRLKRGELVHHVNMVKSDNRNCNLLICDTSYHRWIHEEYARQFARRFLA